MERISFNENWTCNGSPVTLPHDAMLHGSRDQEAPSGSAGAYFHGGSYVYEKTFDRPDAEHVILQFEGVYKNAMVFINGIDAGGAAYGYIPFFVNADGLLRDGENTVRVECDCQDQPDSRWYSGAGIYRPVWLWTGNGDVIEPESVQISTVSCSPAAIRVHSPKQVTVTACGVTGAGTDFTMALPGAELWSDEHPDLHTAHIATADDEADVCFGIREVKWSPLGLYVNGKSTLLRGGCLHHDNGILGACSYAKSELRRVRRMKDAGFNAIRSAHNPASPALIDACDRLGVYLIDESWDMWYNHKSKFDYAGQWRDNYLEDLEAMVRRDFSHPSVIAYSIGNEVSEPASDEGLRYAREMVEFLHELDSTRPVTGGFNLMIINSARKGKGIYNNDEGGRDESGDKKMSGMNSTIFNMIASMVGTGMNKAANSRAADAATSPLLDMLDLAGYNYASGRYPKEGRLHPDRVIYGSETFPQDIAKNWAMVRKYPYLVGDFMWTAIDYLGEAGIGAWAYTPDGKGFNKPYPWLLGDTGAMDILCDPTGELFHASAVWDKLDHPRISVQPVNHPGVKPAKAVWRGTNSIPSWSWQGCAGAKATVEVYSAGSAAELVLNGESLGRRKIKDFKAVFSVKYRPGKLTAIVYDASGNEIGRDEIVSAGDDLRAVLSPEKSSAAPGEIVYVPVTIADGSGITESNVDRLLKVQVENGELLGFGSADPRTEERFDTGEHTTYYGRALAAVRVGPSGNTSVTVNDSGCEYTAHIDIQQDI